MKGCFFSKQPTVTTTQQLFFLKHVYLRIVSFKCIDGSGVALTKWRTFQLEHLPLYAFTVFNFSFSWTSTYEPLYTFPSNWTVKVLRLQYKCKDKQIAEQTKTNRQRDSQCTDAIYKSIYNEYFYFLDNCCWFNIFGNLSFFHFLFILRLHTKLQISF